jgi:hypothetical protein
MRPEDDRSLEARIDAALRRGPVWEPPAGFARRVAARAGEMAREALAARVAQAGAPASTPGRFAAALPSWAGLEAAVLGVLVAALVPLVVRPDGPFEPLTSWLSSGRVTTALAAYERFIARAADLLVKDPTPLGWAAAALSLALAAWFARREIA